MPYTATNDLNDLVENIPLDTDQGLTLGPAMRETRTTFKAVILKEHNSDGTHESVSGAVLVGGSVPTDALADQAVTGAKIGTKAVGTTEIDDGAVTTTQLGAGAVTAAKVATKTLPVANMLGSTSAGIWIAQADGTVKEKVITGDITISALGVAAVTALSTKQGIALFADIETTGTDGGTFTAAAWQVRKLNSTIIDSVPAWNLSANVLRTTVPGTYYVQATAVAYKVDAHQTRLYDTVNNAVLATGTPAISPNGTTVQTESSVEAVIVVAVGGSQSIQLQHYCQTTEAADGLGKNSAFGVDNVFSRIMIIKLA